MCPICLILLILMLIITLWSHRRKATIDMIKHAYKCNPKYCNKRKCPVRMLRYAWEFGQKEITE
ncbi:MAG: hypothetical protein B6V02_00695 [Thermoprotei archaeon ex4572_64]|nr:MAG: hypothetical protein B6V02_00695 [Thermoprotei archaeon ex4572_64]